MFSDKVVKHKNTCQRVVTKPEVSSSKNVKKKIFFLNNKNVDIYRYILYGDI
ncbi:hypothetical protein Hanom_Chr13g01230301 [Helianthus anomalus]